MLKFLAATFSQEWRAWSSLAALESGRRRSSRQEAWGGRERQWAGWGVWNTSRFMGQGTDPGRSQLDIQSCCQCVWLYTERVITLIFWNFSSQRHVTTSLVAPLPPTLLSLLAWRKEDKLHKQLLTSNHYALKATHFCTALHSTLAAFESRLSCI